MAKTFKEQLQNNLNLLKQKLEEEVIVKDETGSHGITVDFNNNNLRWLYAIMNAVTNISYNDQKNAEYLMKNFFPQTANMESLIAFHGNTFGVKPKTATPSTGFVCVNGSEGENILAGSEIGTFRTTETKTIQKFIIPVKDITCLEKRATLKLQQDFNIGSNITISKIYGANESQFNKNNIKITMISTDSFVYDVDEGTPEKATGNIFVEFIGAIIPVISNDNGSSFNKINGTKLSFNIQKLGVNKDCYVCYDGLTGGKEDESLEDFREDVLFIPANLPQGWNRANIELNIRKFQYGKYDRSLIFIPRAEKTDGSVVDGYSTIYIIKQDLTLLSNTELNSIKEYLINTIYRHSSVSNRINVISPSLKTVNIQLKLLGESNTLSMKEAIKNTIKDLQFDQTSCFFRTNLLKKKIEFWLDQVIDSDGNYLEGNYELISPTEDVEIAYNEFPILTLEWL